jgi:hypothetical protein
MFARPEITKRKFQPEGKTFMVGDIACSTKEEAERLCDRANKLIVKGRIEYLKHKIKFQKGVFTTTLNLKEVENLRFKSGNRQIRYNGRKGGGYWCDICGNRTSIVKAMKKDKLLEIILEVDAAEVKEQKWPKSFEILGATVDPDSAVQIASGTASDACMEAVAKEITVQDKWLSRLLTVREESFDLDDESLTKILKES